MGCCEADPGAAACDEDLERGIRWKDGWEGGGLRTVLPAREREGLVGAMAG